MRTVGQVLVARMRQLRVELDRLIDEADDDDLAEWRCEVESLISIALGKGHTYAEELPELSTPLLGLLDLEGFAEGAARTKRIMDDAIREISARVLASERVLLQPAPAPRAELSRKVFVVHGHDNEAKETVARFLTRLGFDPIILHEQASRGQTIIEKFVEHSDVGFAVILLTPDDHGRAKGAEDEHPRARQNVVLELGYFLGRLGRDRVCAVRRGGVEIPSDVDGVVYTTFDDGAWQHALIKELKAAEYEVDANLAF